jgi:NAD(P)-dependent dehydrogenase (short-subunit alcohol dehydrogenase family)
VFYPVRPIIGTSIPNQNQAKLSESVVILVINSTLEKDQRRGKLIADSLEGKVRQLIVLVQDKKNADHFKGLHCHSVDFSNEEEIGKIFGIAKSKFSNIDVVVMLTGDFDYNVSLLSLNRSNWDHLVEKYVMIPALITRSAVTSMAPPGALDEPSLFKSTKGKVIIIGPDAPLGKKISGLVRSRSEVFRGALRPFNATVNQELRDVLNSNIRQYLLLCGNLDGNLPNEEKIKDLLLDLMGDNNQGNNQTILYPDEY